MFDSNSLMLRYAFLSSSASSSTFQYFGASSYLAGWKPEAWNTSHQQVRAKEASSLPGPRHTCQAVSRWAPRQEASEEAKLTSELLLEINVRSSDLSAEMYAVFNSKNQNSKKKIPAPAWRLKSRRNKKRIATAACKSRDESNEPN